MSPRGRPPGTTKEHEVRAQSLRHEEESNLRAQRAHRQKDFGRIRQLSGDGMSRKRLVEIYGQDLVDQALATGQG